MSKPITYRVQDGCHGCRHCFVRGDYDQGPEYFCTLDAPPRPPCRSVAMGECEPSRDFGSDWNAQLQDSLDQNAKWHEWSMPREVMPWGVCDSFVPAPPAPSESEVSE